MNEYRTPHSRVAPDWTTVLRRPGFAVQFLGIRTWIKRVLIGAYCRRIVPACAVTTAFRLLRLRGL